jgi:hypothetical protein
LKNIIEKEYRNANLTMPVVPLVYSGSGSIVDDVSGSGLEEDRKRVTIFGMIMLSILCLALFVIVSCFCRIFFEECRSVRCICKGIVNKCKSARNFICCLGRKTNVTFYNELSTMVILDMCVPEESKFNETCAICLDDLSDNERHIGLKCGHVYHSRCIIPWFKSQIDNGNNPTCPLCKENVRVQMPKQEKKFEYSVNYDSDSSHGSYWGD